MTGLGEKLQTAGVDAIRDFKASQSFIDLCAGYYGTGFDDCLQQVASAFSELDLTGITMDDGDDGSPQPNPTLEHDDSVVLAQLAANLAASNSPTVIVDVEDHQADGNNADVPAPWFLFCILAMYLLYEQWLYFNHMENSCSLKYLANNA